MFRSYIRTKKRNIYTPRLGSPEKNFKARIRREGEHLIWTGALDSRGYGRLGGSLPAHRLAWRLAGNKETPGMEICHLCDRRDCVEVKHLYEGTHYENMQDAKRAGVMGKRINPKLTREKLTSILFDVIEGRLLLKEIAAKHRISPAYLTKIKKGDIIHAKS
jgi:HNH endonuclease